MATLLLAPVCPASTSPTTLFVIYVCLCVFVICIICVLSLSLSYVCNLCPPHAGSREGGNPLTLNAPSTSIGFNTTAPEQNKVFISGIPCTITSVASHQLICSPGAMTGRVVSEYWQLASNTRGLPAIETYGNPGTVYMLFVGHLGLLTRQQCTKEDCAQNHTLQLTLLHFI